MKHPESITGIKNLIIPSFFILTLFALPIKAQESVEVIGRQNGEERSESIQLP